MSADVLNRAELYLGEVENQLNGFVVACQRNLCDAAYALLVGIRKNLVDAHDLLEQVDELPQVIEDRYMELASGLEGAMFRFRQQCG